MRVTVELYGLLKTNFEKARVELEDVADGTTILQLVESLGVSKTEPWIASMDGKLAEDGTRLVDGALVLVFPPMDGGAKVGVWRLEVGGF